MGDWTPKTELGKKVATGEITDIDYIFGQGTSILEPEIVDFLLPGMDNELVLIGGTPGKGGGIRRTAGRRTSRMHKSGSRNTLSVMAIVGNKDGYVGVGIGRANDFRPAAQKATKQAKLSVIPVRRGCGSWECGCGTRHTIPAKAEGKSGSVEVELMPAPRGIGLAVSDEVKKLFDLAGIDDIWIKSRGQTQTRINHIQAVMNALKNLNSYKFSDASRESCAVQTGGGVRA